MHPSTFDALAVAAAGPDAELGRPPRGFARHAVVEPPAVDHAADEVAAENTRAAASAAPLTREEAAREVGLARVGLRLGLLSPAHLDAVLARAGKALAAGLAIVALAVVALVASPAPKASAAEIPEPDPSVGVVSTVVPVTITSQTVRVSVPVVAAPGHCLSVYGPSESGRGWVGGGCSYSGPAFTIPVTLDARLVPVGRSYLSVVDDYDPLSTYPQTIALQARIGARFGLGSWKDRGDGTIAVRVPVQRYSPAAGTWAPASGVRVVIQRRIAGRWTTAAALTTNRRGVAARILPLDGPGVYTLRATSPALRLTGTTRYVSSTDFLTTDPN